MIVILSGGYPPQNDDFRNCRFWPKFQMILTFAREIVRIWFKNRSIRTIEAFRSVFESDPFNFSSGCQGHLNIDLTSIIFRIVILRGVPPLPLKVTIVIFGPLLVRPYISSRFSTWTQIHNRQSLSTSLPTPGLRGVHKSVLAVSDGVLRTYRVFTWFDY